ncbi:hypothetical protein [Bdellovibrio sp. HCB337]|uniref:hypothetical protein n=1 Tax=Bdellovibrio sp. HCB337 TaxID=3394358 RepID=UPI0039A6C4C8
MRGLITAFIFFFIPSVFANSTGDYIRCLKGFTGNEQAPFYVPLETDGAYVTENSIYRTRAGHDDYSGTWYQHLKINNDTGPNGMCIKCQDENCTTYSQDWKSSQDFPKDCDKFNASFTKATRQNDLDIVIAFAFLNFKNEKLPDNSKEALKIRDRIEQMSSACEGLTGPGARLARISIESKAEDLKKKFNLSSNIKVKSSAAASAGPAAKQKHGAK